MYIENNATNFQKEMFIYYAKEMKNMIVSAADLIKWRLIRMYENSYSESVFKELLENEMGKLGKWVKIPVIEIVDFSQEEMNDFINDYKVAFNRLHRPFCDPGQMFVYNHSYNIINPEPEKNDII